MKTNGFSYLSFLIGAAPLLFNTGLSAAPLTWFPGPQLDWTVSGAATVVDSRLGNVLIGGDYNPYPLGLVVSNIYWTPLSAMSGISIAAGAMDSGDFIIIFGGTDGTGSTSAVFGYSPSGDTNQPFASMSVARSYLGYATVKGNAYAIGGLGDNGQALASAESFSSESGPSGTWTTIAGLPAARYDFPAVTDGTNLIYVFGGYTDATAGTEVASALRYSVSKNTWTAIAAMPVPAAGSSAAFGADGKIYVVGGVSGGVTINVVQVYDPVANSWTISTPLPEGLSAAAMSVDSLGRLIVMGGMDTNGYDVADVWRSQRLGAPDSPPVLTQFPGTNAAYGDTYTSSVGATGNPQPVYVLVSGPTNMSVDHFSGQIAWTPSGADQIGAIPITIAATNYAGAANWTFIINVTPPPPIAPTNVVVAGETETSVTLSWDPESPLVGPVTYTFYERHVAYKTPAHYVAVSSNLLSTSVTIGGLAVGSTHTYAIAAVAGTVTSPRSRDITITTLKPQPAANLRVTALTSSSTSLAWDPSPGPVPIAYYSLVDEIYTGAITNTLEANLTGITSTSITFTGQTPGTTHYYFLYAHDASGNSSTADILQTYNPVPTPAALAPVIATSVAGGFTFTVQANAVQTMLIQATTNLADPASWVIIATNPPSSSAFRFTDTNAALYPVRFYRTVAP
jgi:Kelch motif